MLVMNQRNKLFLKMETVYFAENYADYQSSDADIVLFYLSRHSIPGAREFHTLWIDLKKTEEELLRDMHRTTRNKIRHWEREKNYHIDILSSPTHEEVRRFCRSYDDFARNKGIKDADEELLLMARDKGALRIFTLYDEMNNDICACADIHDEETVLNMYAYSHFRKFSDPARRNWVSQANRYLHWEMIRYYKEQGFSIFDMGGLGMGKESKDLDTVDEFKLSFGGQVETLFHFYLPKSVMGKLVVFLLQKNKHIEY